MRNIMGFDPRTGRTRLQHARAAARSAERTPRAAHVLFGGAMLLWLALAGTARASDGVYEINADCVNVGCFAGDTPGAPVNIVASGRYRLSSDLDGVGIVFGAAALDVDLDLHGFAIDGGGSCAPQIGALPTCSGNTPGTAVDLPALAAGSYYTLHLHDGAVRGFNTGLYLNSLASGSSFENLVVSDHGSIAPAFILDKVQNGAAIRVAHCEVLRNHGDGLTANTNATPFKLVVTDSVFSENGNQGLSVYTGAVVTGSRFLDNSGYGFYCGGAGAPAASAIGGNAFLGNKPATANAEYFCVIRDMGGNVCLDGTCP